MLSILWFGIQRFSHRLGISPEQIISLQRFNWVFGILLIGGIFWILKGFSRIEFLKSKKIEIGILLLTAFSLSMLIDSGYFWDDSVNLTKYLYEKFDGIPLWKNVLHFIKLYLELGRINILSFYYYFFFYIENVHVYKALIIILILVDQCIFEWFLKKVGFSEKWARIGMLIIPLLLQTRTYQDPVNGFYGLMQVITAELLLSGGFFIRWIKTEQKRDLVWSLCFFTIGLLTYEVSFPFVLMFFLLACAYEKTFVKAIRRTLPFAVVTAAALATWFFVKMNVGNTAYAGVAFSLDFGKIARAFWYQLTAALPLSFYAAAYESFGMGRLYPAAELMNYSVSGFFKDIQALDWMLLILAVWIIRTLKEKGGDPEEKSYTLPILAAGFSFWVLPTLTIAISERYQGQLLPGLGYLPVYIEYYGIAILFLLLLRFCERRFGSLFRIFGTTAFCIILLLNLQNNRAVTEVMNRAFEDPRRAGTAALKGGILDFLPDDARLLTANDGTYIWEKDWNDRGLYHEFYRIYSGKDLNVTRLENPVEGDYIFAYTGDHDHGIAKLGRITNVTDEGIITEQVIYFLSGKYPTENSIAYVSENGDFNIIRARDHAFVRKSEQGVLCQLEPYERVLFESVLLDQNVYIER